MAIGTNAAASGYASSATGTDSVASGFQAMSNGVFARAVGEYTVAFGRAAFAANSQATAIGALSSAAGLNAVAIGGEAVSRAAGATAIGGNTDAVAVNSTALGQGARAGFAGSTALGTGAATTRANQVMLGGAGSSVAIADLAASDAAQTGVEYALTIDNNGTIGRGAQSGAGFGQQSLMISDLQQGQALIDDQLAAQSARIAGLSRGLEQADGGIAASMAMGGTMLVPDSPLSVSFNLSTYRGEQGFSGALVGRVAKRVYVNGGIAGSTVKGSTGGRVGIAFGL